MPRLSYWQQHYKGPTNSLVNDLAQLGEDLTDEDALYPSNQWKECIVKATDVIDALVELRKLVSAACLHHDQIEAAFQQPKGERDES